MLVTLRNTTVNGGWTHGAYTGVPEWRSIAARLLRRHFSAEALDVERRPYIWLQFSMSNNPWWDSENGEIVEDRPLPSAVRLAPDYGAELPLWGQGFGNIGWEFTKFTPELLDRLADWQQEFETHYNWESGWSSARVRERWTKAGTELARDVRAELGDRAELVVDLWPRSGR